MTQPVEISLTPVDVPNVLGGVNYDVDHFATDVTGDTWTLSNTATTDGIAHQVSIRNDSATDHSDKTALLTGTDEDDKAITETVTLPGSSAIVNSTLYFKTLTSIVPSASIGADTMDIGVRSTITTQTIPTNHHRAYKGIFVDITGTVDYTVQVTGSKIETATRPYKWINSTNLSNITISAASEDNSSTTGVRLITNSYDSGATLTFQVSQGN